MCREEFQDMRGLTSHVRHMHDSKREELIKRINQKENNTNVGWKILGGIGVIIATVITLGIAR